MKCLSSVYTTLSCRYNVPLSDNEVEKIATHCMGELGESQTDMELWLISLNDDIVLKLYETETVQVFLRICALFLKEYYHAYTCTDIDKGHYCFWDRLYSQIEVWYNAWMKRIIQSFENKYETLSTEIVVLEETEKELLEYVKKTHANRNNIFTSYMEGDDIEERLIEAHKVQGHGRYAMRKIMKILFPITIPEKGHAPTYELFEKEFPCVIGCKSEYHVVLDEMRGKQEMVTHTKFN